MSIGEWSRPTLWALGAYAALQLALYTFVLQATIISPTRGYGAGPCADSTFAVENAPARLAQFDTQALIAQPYGRAVHGDEDVFRQLSLLRESTRDGWVHFAGDSTLKPAYFEYASILNKNGVNAQLSPRVVKKRLTTLRVKDDARIGSSKLSFRHAPLYADVTRDFERIWKEVNPPSLIVLSVGTWDALNRTSEAREVIEADQDALVESIRSRMQVRSAAGKRLPIVLFLSPPIFVDQMATTVTESAREAIERADQLTELMRTKVASASVTIQDASLGSLTQGSSALGPMAFGDIKTLATPVHGRVPEFADHNLHVFLNPTTNALSLAAFTACALGQPSWELRAFSPGQICLASLWVTALFLWAYRQIKAFTPTFGTQRGSYQRVSLDANEVELGQASGGATVGAGPKSVPLAEHEHLTPTASFIAYFSSSAWEDVLACLVQLGCVLLFVFLMDGNQRISWSIVGDKQYVRDTFLFLIGVIGVLAWRSMSVTSDGGDSLLNREQTEEWKGWMQILFVLYHFFAAKEMYNQIRILIAAYVWMTGYGNFFFFYKTNDYSFARLMKLMFRLNFFVAFVCVALNREFMQYYVCALHTFYFLCVYATMGIAWQWNKNDKLLALKFVILFAILFLLFDVPSLGLFKAIFGPFNLFYWNGSLWEWWFRSKLDHYATLFGMICAWHAKRIEDLLAKIEGQANTLHKHLLQGFAAAVLIGLGLVWMVFCLWQPKTAYNEQHPYTSIIPIVLYILLRNLTPWLRRHVLHLFTWFGKITLETYILQFHIWLSDDAATIITYLPNYPMLNFVLSTAVYIALSVLIFQITNVLSDALIPRGCSVPNLIFKMLLITGGWYTLHNVVQFGLTIT